MYARKRRSGLWSGVVCALVLCSLSFAGAQQQRLPSAPAAGTAPVPASIAGLRYVGSAACQSCHTDIYARWQKTPMANVVRDPRQHPDAIIPDLTKADPLLTFSRDQIGLVYGSVWKQRYFTRMGNDYYPQTAQWDVTHKIWRPYFVANGTDWWATLYPLSNFQRPTSALCDGCHSVNFDISNNTVAEWNVGCERCHGPGSAHAARPTRANIVNPARTDSSRASDVCMSCHSQGQPLTNPMAGKYYDWPVGYHVGLNLQDYWKFEEHKLGELTFTHFPEGTAHKNRMQGNDFVQSVMYKHGITCFSCHDVHGTNNQAQLRAAPNVLCQTCHQPGGTNGPRAATLEAHTHHAANSAGSQCISCHMPKIEVTIADVNVASHTFAFIYPSMTDQYKIPNPCTSCHTDQTTAWATQTIRSWPERSPWRAE